MKANFMKYPENDAVVGTKVPQHVAVSISVLEIFFKSKIHVSTAIECQKILCLSEVSKCQHVLSCRTVLWKK